MSGATSYRAGQSAEQIVERIYVEKGHDLIERRWRGQGGEIDLIFREGEGIICVEVKKSGSFARAAERISAAQQQRIYAAAAEYIGRLPNGQMTEVRFDAALVDVAGHVQIIENAFGL